MTFDDGPKRTCALEIAYYDWEGNAERRADDAVRSWRTRTLILRFGFLAAFDYSTPDLIGRALVVDRLVLGDGLEALIAQEEAQAARYPGYRSHLLGRDVVSIKLLTHNWSDTDQGYLLVIGADCSVTWASSEG